MSIGRYLQRVTYFTCGLIFTSSLIVAQMSEAATYYVATTGNDTATGTESQPFRTINRGVKGLKSGDTLIIKAGTFAERISSIPSGTATSQTVIKANQKGTVTLQPSGTGNIIEVSNTASYITLDGLILDGSNLPKTESLRGIKINGTGPLDGASRITVRNTEIRNTYGTCLNVAGSFHLFSYVKISNCRTPVGGSLGAVGIYLGARDSILENVEVANADNYGIQLYYSKDVSTVSNNIIRNSIFRNSASRGMYIGGTNNKIYNNVFYGNKNGGILINNRGNIVRNNIAYANPGSYPQIEDRGTNTILSHNLITDPKFVNASGGDFRLRSDSPAIDKGIALNEVSVDYDGVPRPQGAGYDIGVFEYKKTLSSPTNLRSVSSQ